MSKSFLKNFCVPFVSVLEKTLKLSKQEAVNLLAKSISEYVNKDNENVCDYVYVRSPKKGKKCCNLVDKKSSKFCSKHIKKDIEEDKVVAKKKEQPEKIKTVKNKMITCLSKSIEQFVNKKKPVNIKVQRNQFGNYQCIDNILLINPVTQEIIGIQNDDGRIDDLTIKDIEFCKDNNLLYKLPLNLSTNSDKPVEFVETQEVSLELENEDDDDFEDFEE